MMLIKPRSSQADVESSKPHHPRTIFKGRKHLGENPSLEAMEINKHILLNDICCSTKIKRFSKLLQIDNIGWSEKMIKFGKEDRMKFNLKILLWLLLILLQCGAFDKKEKQLLIVYSGDFQGYLEPCG